MQQRCLGRVYLIGGLCEILNGRGRISSACMGLVGERMCENPQVSSHVSSLDKNVLFTWYDKVNDISTYDVIGLVSRKENYKDNQCTTELV